jgi:putative transposase
MKVQVEMHYLRQAVTTAASAGFLRHQNPDKAAALRFIRKAFKRGGSTKAINTDGLRSFKGRH